jgi:hypothetical protein
MDDMKQEMDAIIEYRLNPCEFKDAGDFVAEACDMMTYGYLEDINASAKDTDSFYYHMVDLFGDYLVKFHNKKCGKKNMVTESKLNSTIYDFIDQAFASKDGDTTIFMLDSLDENGKEIDGAYDFVNKDYYSDEGDDYLFSWTAAEYYELLALTHITQREKERLTNMAPIIEMYEKNKLNVLNSYFGDIWKPVFKQWFKDKTGMDYKTLYTEDLKYQS